MWTDTHKTFPTVYSCFLLRVTNTKQSEALLTFRDIETVSLLPSACSGAKCGCPCRNVVFQ
jgi:hypothetical protein